MYLILALWLLLVPAPPEHHSIEWAAATVAIETEVPYTEVLSAFQAAPRASQTAVVAAVEQLGAEYRYASRSPSEGFDCSGLLYYAWQQAGVELPYTSGEQIRATYATNDLQAGDLMYYPGHIMMYLGFGDYIIHSANRRTDVSIGTVSRETRTGSVLMLVPEDPFKTPGELAPDKEAQPTVR